MRPSENQVMYRRMEGEKRIKMILILDRYVDYMQQRNNLHIPDSLVDHPSYDRLGKLLQIYPFSGGHFKCSVSLYCSLLDENNFRVFRRVYGVQSVPLNEVLALSVQQLQKARANKRKLLRQLSKLRP